MSELKSESLSCEFLSTLTICKVTQRFPKDELYGLTLQIRRSAVSIPSNIAGGVHRRKQP